MTAEITLCLQTREELPDAVKDNLPPHAQDIFKEAFNSAHDKYKDPDERRDDASREELRFRVAWAAVKKGGYEKDDQLGRWVRADWPTDAAMGRPLVEGLRIRSS